MNRFFSIGNLIVFGTLLLLVVICVLLRGCFSDKAIKANVYPLNVEVDEPIFYADSTGGIYSVLWEFGNGDTSRRSKGSYTFHEVGKYKVRLKIDDNNTLQFVVNVRDKKVTSTKRQVKILAPQKVIVNERVIFMADGDADRWSWEFGESGKVDSQEQNPIYIFSQVGTHEIRLTAGNMEYPIIQEIEVLPEFIGGITDDPAKKIQEDILEHLQQIIDHRGNFNDHYNYILKKYLGGKASKTVLINNTTENDFYSYCNGLKFLGKQQSTIIEDVTMENNPNGSIKRLLITQSSTK